MNHLIHVLFRTEAQMSGSRGEFLLEGFPFADIEVESRGLLENSAQRPMLHLRLAAEFLFQFFRKGDAGFSCLGGFHIIKYTY